LEEYIVTVLTAEESLLKVQTTSEQIRNDETQRFPIAASVGDTARQGDLYIELLAAVPKGANVIVNPSPQLAPGTTQGSRHILDSLEGVSMYTLDMPSVLDGPILALAIERTVTHPEHGDVVLPAGVYGVTYQKQHADELRRVAD
jgi:hypothetical protein